MEKQSSKWKCSGVQKNQTKVMNPSAEIHRQHNPIIISNNKILKVSRDFKQENTIVTIKDVKIGNGSNVMIAGPCSIESEEQLFETALAVKAFGADILRASAFKPRTNPYAFQGLGIKGLKLLKKIADELEMPAETEVMDSSMVKIAAKYADSLRVGARNMQNFDLLKKLGKINNPVIIKNGLSSNIEEFLGAAEYIVNEGNPNVILCLRGIRTFETTTRFTLDVGLVEVLKQKTHLPVIVDPSHAAGTKNLVFPLSRAALAAGADGLLVEVHRNPAEALSDASQQLTPEQFHKLMMQVREINNAMKKIEAIDKWK